MSVSWSDLNSNILELISHNLDLVDFIYFSAVCRSWRSAVQFHRSRCQVCPKSLIPWLLLSPPYNSKNKEIIKSHFSFYDIVHQKIFSIHVPQPFISIIGSSANGFLVIADDLFDLHVINPLTGAHFPLPSNRFIIRHLSHANHRSLNKAVINFSPLCSSNQPALIVLSLNYALMCIKVGDTEWTRFYRNLGGDIMFHKDHVYGVDQMGTFLFDLDHPFDRSNILDSEFETPEINYFVESPTGDDLFLVRWIIGTEFSAGGHRRVTKGFMVFKLDQSKGRWSEITCLGDHALFVGPNNLFFFPASSSCYDVEKNVIYFIDEMDGGGVGEGVGVFDLGDGSIRRMHLPLRLKQFSDWESFWFTPSLV